mgnify:CR=1 FL=1
MEEQLISFETAKLAKEKGFNILQHSYYFEDGEFKENSLKGTNGYYGEEYEFNLSEFNENWNDKWLTKKTGDRCFGCSKQKGYLETFSAPTQSLLQKWIREVHKIHIDITYDIDEEYGSDYIIIVKTKKEMIILDNQWTYEEALEKGLYQALKLIYK